MKKFELTSETKVVFGRTLYRIKALISFQSINAGDLGGWIEKEENLDQYGDAWVYGNAWVYGDAEVYGNAKVFGGAEVYGDAEVSGDAWVSKIGSVFWISAVGSRNGTATFFKCKDGNIRVVCGCFFGALKEFAERVKETHGENEFGRVYMLAIEIAKVRIGEGSNKDQK